MEEAITAEQKGRFPLMGSIVQINGVPPLPIFTRSTYQYPHGLKIAHATLDLTAIFPAEEFGDDWLAIMGVTQHGGWRWAVYLWESGDLHVTAVARPITVEEGKRLDAAVLRLRAPARAYAEQRTGLAALEVLRASVIQKWHDHCDYLKSILPEELQFPFTQSDGFYGLMDTVAEESFAGHDVGRNYYEEHLSEYGAANMDELQKKFTQIAGLWNGLVTLHVHRSEAKRCISVHYSLPNPP